MHAVVLSFKALHRVLDEAFGQSTSGVGGGYETVLEFATKSLVTGLLVVIPLYLAVLLLLKAMKSVLNLVKPIARLLPESVPAEMLLSLLLVLADLLDVYVRTAIGKVIRDRLEETFLDESQATR